MKYLYLFFVCCFLNKADAFLTDKRSDIGFLTIKAEKESTAGFFSMQYNINRHIKGQQSRKEFSGNELSVMHIVPTEVSDSDSCAEDNQMYYHFSNSWETSYRCDSDSDADNEDCTVSFINGKGLSSRQCWEVLNTRGHSMAWLQNIMRGNGPEGSTLDKECPDSCSYYNTIVRYYTGDCENEEASLIVYCGPKRKSNEWNIYSYIVKDDSPEQNNSGYYFENFVYVAIDLIIGKRLMHGNRNKLVYAQ